MVEEDEVDIMAGYRDEGMDRDRELRESGLKQACIDTNLLNMNHYYHPKRRTHALHANSAIEKVTIGQLRSGVSASRSILGLDREKFRLQISDHH